VCTQGTCGRANPQNPGRHAGRGEQSSEELGLQTKIAFVTSVERATHKDERLYS